MPESLEVIFHHTVWALSYTAVLIGLSAYGIHRYCTIWLFLRTKHNHPQPLSRFRDLPNVTIQLPVFNEFYVVRRLLEAVSQIDYPRAKLHIQILDDSTDETRDICAAEAARLNAAGFDIEHLHRTNRAGFKAGALENGLPTAKGDLIFILDADFVPQPDCLRLMVDYFTDPAVGMVQTRWGHLNRNASLLTRIQAILLDGHFLLEQTARSRSGKFFNFNGTGGIWRKSCILDAGGWEHDTLTEDLDLSYRAQLRGWQFVFLPDVVIPAELPVDMNGFKSQQHRWTKGSVQTCKKLLPAVWRAPLPLSVKLEATAHLSSNLAYLLLAFLCVLILPQSMARHAGNSQFLLVDLAVFLSTTVAIFSFHVVAQAHMNPRGWWKDLLLFPMLLAVATGLAVNNARAVLEALVNIPSEFTRTPKYGLDNAKPRLRKVRYLPLKSLLPAVEILFAAYFAYCIWHAIQIGHYATIPFLLIFLAGFLYVSSKSTAFWFGQIAAIASPPARAEA